MRPVFSCDSGLYFDDLEAACQPGTHIRRVNGKELTDEEMTAYYADLAQKHNDRLVGRYRNAICLMLDEETVFQSMDEALATEAFILCSTPHEKRVKGFPLDCLSLDIESGKYYYDLQDRSVDQSAVEQGFWNFFASVLESDAGQDGRNAKTNVVYAKRKGDVCNGKDDKIISVNCAGVGESYD